MKYIKFILISALIFSNTLVFADFQCEGFRLHAAKNGWTKVNGEQVTSQKVSFLNMEDDWNNVKVDMGLMPASDGNNYGFECVKRNGKAFLNVQLLQADMDVPPIIGSYPCKKVSD